MENKNLTKRPPPLRISIIILYRYLYGKCCSTLLILVCIRDDGSQLIERMASEFNQLQFYVTQSQGHPLVESIRGVCDNNIIQCTLLTQEVRLRLETV